MRDRPVATKVPGEFRILALGDSVTFGWGAAQSEIFAERLESLLSRAVDRPVVVLNTGVGAYNTAQELGVLRKLGPVLEPDLLLLTYVINDVEIFSGPFDPWSVGSLKGNSPPENIKVLLGRLWLYRLVVHELRYGGLAFSAPAPEDSTGRSRGWRESMESLEEIARTANDAGIPLVVVFFRSAPEDSRALLAAVTAAVAPARVVDTAPWYAGRDIRALTNSHVDPHPNGQGHALLADGIAGELLAAGLIPPKPDARP